MKVAHIVRQYLPSIGGMEEVVRNLAQYQQKNSRYEPTVITLDRVFREPNAALPHRENMDGIPVHRLAYRGSERYPLCPQVLGQLREADLIHVHGIDFFFDYLALTRGLHGKPLIASTHGGFFHTQFARRLKNFYFTKVTRRSAGTYRRIIATSENDGDTFRRIVADSRLRVIENGVDIEKFANASSPLLQPTMIYFGRWSANKGLLETLEVFAALCAQQADTPWHLIIAGREYDLDALTLLQRAQTLGIADRLSIVPGPSNERLHALIGQSSYFICLSHHEGFGIAPIEAMSAGLIPILSAIPPFKHLQERSGIGLILDPGDPQTQARQIAKLHASHCHPEQHPDQDHRASAQQAAAPYSWAGVAAAYVQQYDQVMDES
jgi:alpha-1,3-mannosyltransferase